MDRIALVSLIEDHPMNCSADQITCYTRQVLTWVAFSLSPALFAASGPPPVPIEGEVTVKGTVDVEVINDALKIPFNRTIQVEVPANQPSFEKHIPGIPAGKRLVIETFSALAIVPSGQAAFASITASSWDSALAWVYHAPLNLVGEWPGGTRYIGLHKLRVTCDPRAVAYPSVRGSRNVVSGTAQFQITVGGYLEDIPAVPVD